MPVIHNAPGVYDPRMTEEWPWTPTNESNRAAVASMNFGYGDDLTTYAT